MTLVPSPILHHQGYPQRLVLDPSFHNAYSNLSALDIDRSKHGDTRGLDHAITILGKCGNNFVLTPSLNKRLE